MSDVMNSRDFFFFFLQLYCPIGISPVGYSGCFSRGKAAATELRYPTYCACWMFLCFHNPSDSGMDYKIFNVHTDIDACDCTRGMYGRRRKDCTES